MSAHKNLPIYRLAQQLVSHLHQSTRKAPRDLRHTLVQRLLDESVEICVRIVLANRTDSADRTTRAKRITAAMESIARVDVLLLVAREQHCLSMGAAAVAMEHIDKLGGQAHRWGAHTLGHGGQPESKPSRR